MLDVTNFDPENVSQEDLDRVADSIENYIRLMDRIMLIPENLQKEEKNIRKGMERSRVLIKRLRKGKHVFKDQDD